MKKLLLMKTVLLLFALVVGSGSAWAEDVLVSFTSLGTQKWTSYSLTSGAVTISTNLNNGSAPTTSNAQYRWKTNNIITISTSTGTLKSIRFKTNSTAAYGPKCLSYNSSAITSSGTDYTWNAPSGISSADFTVTSECRLTEIHVTYTTSGGGGSSVTAPSFEPGAGAITAGSTVTLTQAAADQIRYTLDGTDPTITTGTVYSDPISITKATTIKAIAIKGEEVSTVATAAYTISVAYPAFNLSTGRYFLGTEITLTSASNTIYYNLTTDGTTPSDPTNASTEYTAPIVLSSATTKIKAIAYDAYGNKSSITDRTYTGVGPATLPFTFDEEKAAIETTTGLIHSGLGSDYNNSPYLKFDSADDYVILYFDGVPGTLTFDIKGNGSGSDPWAGTFTVQTSADGETYTDLKSYTSLSSKQSESFANELASDVRYIKWIYTAKTTGNVALGNIKLTSTVAFSPAKEYTTLTSAKNLDFTSVSSNLKAYIATTISGDEVQMVKVNKVPANTGLVLKATTPGSAVNVPVFDGTGADDVSGNKMAGSATETTAVAENAGYILSNGVFQPSSGGTLAAGKAYLAIAVSSARALEMNFDDDVTAIEAVKTQNVENGQYFNLAGQRVANPTKGLYIVNGKKVIIK